MRKSIILVLFLYCVLPCFCDIELPPDWERPNAWGGGKVKQKQSTGYTESDHSSRNDVQVCQQMQQKYDVLEIYYHKLVNYLVNQDKLRRDKVTQKFVRHLRVELSDGELLKFEDLRGKEPFKIDALIFEILTENNDGFINDAAETLFTWADRIRYFLEDLAPTEDIKFLLYISAFLLFVWVVARHMNRNFVLTFLIVIFSVSYLFDYRKCCHEKQIKTIREMTNLEKNPCDNQKPNTWFEQIFGSKSDDECNKYLLQKMPTLKTDNFCHPFEHFIDFIVYKNLMVFIEKMGAVMETVLSKQAFPYNVLVLMMFIFLLKDILKHFVEYSFRLFVMSVRQDKHRPDVNVRPVEQIQQAYIPRIENLPPEGDELRRRNIQQRPQPNNEQQHRDVQPVQIAIVRQIRQTPEPKIEDLPPEGDEIHIKDTENEKLPQNINGPKLEPESAGDWVNVDNPENQTKVYLN